MVISILKIEVNCSPRMENVLFIQDLCTLLISTMSTYVLNIQYVSSTNSFPRCGEADKDTVYGKAIMYRSAEL